MNGGIIIARSLWDDAAFQNEAFSEREAWVWMIAEASWKNRQKRVGNVIVTIDRGQLAHSTRFLADVWRWSHSKARRFLERLEKLKMIRVQTDTGVSVITLCKYNEYQLSPQATDTAAAQQRHSSGTNENKDEIRVKEGELDLGAVAPPKPRATRISRDWFLPMDWGEWAVDQGLSKDQIRLEADRFKDYWIAKSGQGASKLDWQATWRNWIRNAKGSSNGNGNHNSRQPTEGRGNRIDPAIEQIARLTGLNRTSGDGGFGIGCSGKEI